MKIIKATFLYILLFAVMQANGQSSIQPFDATFEHDDAQRPCIQVNIDPEPKTLKNAWKDYLNDKHDFKLKGIGFLSNKDLLSAEEVKVESISSKEMDFYTHIDEDDNGSEMKVFVRYGYDIYLNRESNPDEYLILNQMVEDFLKSYLPKYYQGKISDTEKRVEELTDESKKLKEDIADNAKEIEKRKKEIKDLEKEMETNSKQLESSSRKLIKRKDKLKRIKSQLKEL